MAAKKDNIFSRAKAYCAKHPRTSFQDAIKIVAKKKVVKKAVKKTAKKKSATVGRKPAKQKARKLKIKIKPGKKGGGSFTIGAMSMSRINQEYQHQKALEGLLSRHQGLLKEKGLKPMEKAKIRREIKMYRTNIAASKKHVNALKRSI